MKYINSNTLSSKSKSFRWSFDLIEGLSISRMFSNVEKIDVFTPLEIEKILQFTFLKGKVPLANSVDKMHNGTEKEGLGSFVYQNISKNEQKAQAMSQFAAIMVDTNIFEYNGASRNMEFWIKNIDWNTRLINEFI